MVRGGAVDCAAGDDGDAIRVVDHFARVCPGHLRLHRQTLAVARQPGRWSIGWRLRGSGMDGVRDSSAETDVQPHRDRVDRRRLVERVAPASESLVNERRIRRVAAIGLSCGHCVRCVRRIPDGIQGLDGLGLRTHRKSVHCGVDARQHHDEPAGTQPVGDLRSASRVVFVRARGCFLDCRGNHSRRTRLGSLSSRKPTNFECRK